MNFGDVLRALLEAQCLQCGLWSLQCRLNFSLRISCSPELDVYATLSESDRLKCIHHKILKWHRNIKRVFSSCLVYTECIGSEKRLPFLPQ